MRDAFHLRSAILTYSCPGQSISWRDEPAVQWAVCNNSHRPDICNESPNSSSAFIAYFLFSVLEVFPILLRLPCLVDDLLLDDFFTFPRLSSRLVDA
ncbi:hypothetical protein MRX96_000431 [Rhipicephalus microplus]